jgi:copper chaperone
MAVQIAVDNIKCGGCAATIRGKLEEAFAVPVTVDVEQGVVSIAAPPEQRNEIAARLRSLGYPEAGSVAGLQGAGAKARSFVSCAIGRMRPQESRDDGAG